MIIAQNRNVISFEITKVRWQLSENRGRNRLEGPPGGVRSRVFASHDTGRQETPQKMRTQPKMERNRTYRAQYAA